MVKQQIKFRNCPCNFFGDYIPHLKIISKKSNDQKKKNTIKFICWVDVIQLGFYLSFLVMFSSPLHPPAIHSFTICLAVIIHLLSGKYAKKINCHWVVTCTLWVGSFLPVQIYSSLRCIIIDFCWIMLSLLQRQQFFFFWGGGGWWWWWWYDIPKKINNMTCVFDWFLVFFFK